MEETAFGKSLFALLVLAILSLPLQVSERILPVYLFGSSFPVLDLFRLLTIGGLFVLIVRLLFGGKLTIPKDAISVSLYLFAGISIVSLLFFPSGSGLREVVRCVFHLGFYLLILNSVRGSGDLTVLWKFLIASGLAASLFAIFQYFTGFYLWNEGLGAVLRRVNATFSDPNVLASFLGMIVLFSVAYYGRSEKKSGRIFSASVAVTSLIALLFTFSRAGLVATAVSGLLLAVLLPKHWRNILLYLLLLVAAVAASLASADVRERVANIYTIAAQTGASASSDPAAGQEDWEELSSADKYACAAKASSYPSAKYTALIDRAVAYLPLNRDRASTVKAGILMFIDNPIFGVGSGNFQSVYLGEYCHLIVRKERPETAGNPVTLSHSSFVTIAVEWGLVGVLWFIVFVAAFFRMMRQTLKKGTALDSFVAAVGSGMLLLLLHTQLRGSLFSDPYFWLLCGFLTSSKMILDKDISRLFG